MFLSADPMIFLLGQYGCCFLRTLVTTYSECLGKAGGGCPSGLLVSSDREILAFLNHQQ